MSKTTLFEAFIQTTREQVPVCPHCGQPTMSAFVCKDCRVIHCWYCNYALREVPKNIYRDAASLIQYPVDLLKEDGSQPSMQEILEDTLEKMKGHSMDEVHEWLTQLVMELKFTCPECGLTLNDVYLCEEGHVHCQQCDLRLRDMPTELWAICVAHDTEQFHYDEGYIQ
jgi:hypothetical protein